MAALAAAIAGPSVGRCSDDSPTRPEDLVFFGLYGGFAFSSVAQVTHWSDGGVRSELDGVEGAIAPVGGYAVSWWPLDYFGLDGSFEVFGLPLAAASQRFDACELGDGASCSPNPKTPSYGGVGLQTGPTFRGALPLRYVQLNGGAGLMLPVTFQPTQEPVSRLDEIAHEVGAALRLVGGLNGYVARDWRAMIEYRLDYRFATIPSASTSPDAISPTLENAGLLTQMLVTGFSYSPESYKESPDKASWIVWPFALPVAGWVIAAIVKAAQTGPES